MLVILSGLPLPVLKSLGARVEHIRKRNCTPKSLHKDDILALKFPQNFLFYLLDYISHRTLIMENQKKIASLGKCWQHMKKIVSQVVFKKQWLF